MSFKATVAQRFAELLYEGEWFSPLMEAVNAFVDSTQAVVAGTVKLKLWKGSLACAGISSPYSLYDHSLASFTTGPLFDHHDSTGFINLYSLPVKARGIMMARALAESKTASATATGAAFASTAKTEESHHVHGSGGSCLSSTKTAAAY